MLASDKINMQRLVILVVDDNAQAADIMAQVMAGFGARDVIRKTSAAEAMEVLSRSRVDLVLTDAMMPEMDGYELVRWIRREAMDANRYAPVVLVTGHTRLSKIEEARDCGANFVITKPIKPAVLLDRIFWVGKESRMFIDSDGYAGPDRRFKFEGPPADMEGRRVDDLPVEVGEATEANLSQEQVNAMMKTSKVSI